MKGTKCSRERSRNARAVLDEFFFSVLQKNHHELPDRCPFKQSKDIYLEHEKHKVQARDARGV